MQAVNYVRREMEPRAEHSDAALSDLEVDPVVQSRGSHIARQRGEEDEGDDGVCKAIVFL